MGGKMSMMGKKKSGSQTWLSLEDRQQRGSVEARMESQFAMVSPDVGEDAAVQEKRRQGRPTLVDGGRHTGESRVVYRGHNIPLHLVTKDFFISVVQLDTGYIVLGVASIYVFFFFAWSLVWWLIVRYDPGCLYGAGNYVEALTFSVVTQMTIGYGNTGPQSCWAATWVIIIQSIVAVLLEAVTLGVVFARISHPHQRSRSIFMSNKAVVARRDGILKFMFRVADIRATQVVEPKVKAYLYTWGQGRITAEGERIPVRVEPLDVDYIDGMLLLPLIIEHTIDERSPLCGHDHASLVALSAELVVTFEGTTEMGNPFMARRSYIPEEIYWGYQFVNVVARPDATDGFGHYEVSLDQFHKVEKQESLPNLHPMQLSRMVVNRAKRTVPYPLLGENTLVLSDVLCVAPNEDGLMTLYCRVGDTYPNQMLEITAKILFYRWKDPKMVQEGKNKMPAPEGEAYEQFSLECGYETGADRLHLRLPTLLTHVIDADSPLAAWREPKGVMEDMMSEVVVVINAYMNTNNNNVLRQRTYTVNHHVRMGYGFVPIVKHPALARDNKPRVRWQHFHDVQRVEGMEEFEIQRRNVPGGGGIGVGDGTGLALTTAPESHANMRSLLSGGSHENYNQNDFTVLPMDLQRYAAAVGGDASQITGSPRADGALFADAAALDLDDTLDASTSLPYAAALHPTLPGPDRFRQTDAVMMMEERNDYTVTAPDLSRYSVSMATQDSMDVPRTYRGKTITTTTTAAAAAAAALSSGAPPPQTTLTTPAVRRGTTSSSSRRESDAVAGGSAMPSVPESEPSATLPSPLPSSSSVGALNENENDDSAASTGPLAGFRPMERKASYAAEKGDDEDTKQALASGPLHFSTSKTRKGAKSLKEISSLFQDNDDDTIIDDADAGPDVGGL